jgi:hypothetical protein
MYFFLCNIDNIMIFMTHLWCHKNKGGVIFYDTKILHI